MSKLEKLIHNSYKDLFSIDSEGTIYDDPSHITDLLSPSIIDEATLFTIDILDLFNAINYTQTRTGAATLFRSLLQPLESLELIIEKQNSIKELEKDRKIREGLNAYLNSLAKREPYIHRYLFQCSYCQSEPYNLRFIDQYELYRESMEFFKNMVGGVKDLPSLESAYLEILVEDIRNIDETRVFKLIKGPVYKTFKGLKPEKEVRIYTPRIRFTLHSFKPTLAIPYPALFLLMSLGETGQLVASLATFAFSSFMYSYPRSFDRKHFILPLREMYKRDPNIRRGIEALGLIDELLSFYEYSRLWEEIWSSQL